MGIFGKNKSNDDLDKLKELIAQELGKSSGTVFDVASKLGISRDVITRIIFEDKDYLMRLQQIAASRFIK